MTSNTNFETRCIHSLVKVFADEALREEPCQRGSALIGEYYSFQVAYRSELLMKNIRVSIESELVDDITVRSVGLAPSELPNYDDHDDFYVELPRVYTPIPCIRWKAI